MQLNVRLRSIAYLNVTTVFKNAFQRGINKDNQTKECYFVCNTEFHRIEV